MWLCYIVDYCGTSHNTLSSWIVQGKGVPYSCSTGMHYAIDVADELIMETEEVRHLCHKQHFLYHDYHCLTGRKSILTATSSATCQKLCTCGSTLPIDCQGALLSCSGELNPWNKATKDFEPCSIAIKCIEWTNQWFLHEFAETERAHNAPTVWKA